MKGKSRSEKKVQAHLGSYARSWWKGEAMLPTTCGPGSLLCTRPALAIDATCEQKQLFCRV